MQIFFYIDHKQEKSSKSRFSLFFEFSVSPSGSKTAAIKILCHVPFFALKKYFGTRMQNSLRPKCLKRWPASVAVVARAVEPRFHKYKPIRIFPWLRPIAKHECKRDVTSMCLDRCRFCENFYP